MPLTSFNDPATAKKLLDAIRHTAGSMQLVTIMEVCGTHTHEIGRLGLRSMLPETVKLISGPGCPVCVTPGAYIDAAADLAAKNNVIIATFGDMVRVPGNRTSLATVRAAGARIEVVSSPLDAIRIAKENPACDVIFIAVGFETTIPAIARAVVLAHDQQLKNLSFLTALRLVPPCLAVLCKDKELAISGFMLPGHVSAIIGEQAYSGLKKYRIPGVITGFEPLDILGGILELLSLTKDHKPDIFNAYRRTVPAQGNLAALKLIDTVFQPGDADLRGIGTIPGSGLFLRKEFSAFDAEIKYRITITNDFMPKGCSCGSVLKGKITPDKCPLFGKACTPENPQGPCMVSSEGSCAAYYKYER